MPDLSQFDASALLALLHEADGYLTLMHRYRSAPVPEDVRQEMIAAGNRCRAMAKQLELIQRVEERRADPEFAARLEGRICDHGSCGITEHRDDSGKPIPRPPMPPIPPARPTREELFTDG